MKKAVLRRLREMESREIEAEVKIIEPDNFELSLEQPKDDIEEVTSEVKPKKNFGLKKKKSDK